MLNKITQITILIDRDEKVDPKTAIGNLDNCIDKLDGPLDEFKYCTNTGGQLLLGHRCFDKRCPRKVKFCYDNTYGNRSINRIYMRLGDHSPIRSWEQLRHRLQREGEATLNQKVEIHYLKSNKNSNLEAHQILVVRRAQC